MKGSWKYLFRDVILDRGEDIYYSGDITDIHRTEDGWEATAHGTWDYEVDVTVENDSVKYMSCTCPYADEGRNCKHMAALLFALEENDFEEEESGVQPEDAYSVLEHMSEEELRRQLREIMQEDMKYRGRIFSRFRKTPVGNDDIRQIGARLENLAYEIGDRYGFIDWRHGSEYVHAFTGCLEDSLEPMLKRNEYMPAFEVLKKAFMVLNQVEMDGSDGEHSDIASEIEAYWDRMIHMASAAERDSMHEWFTEMQSLGYDLICYDSIDNILENSFDDEKYIAPLIEETESALNRTDLNFFREAELLDRYRSLLERSGRGTQKYEEWLNMHADHTAVKEARLEDARSRNDIDAEITLLKDLAGDQNSRYEGLSGLKSLLKAYEKKEDTAAVKDTLKTILTAYPCNDMEKIHQMRSLCEAQEWSEIREAVLERDKDLRIEIFREEKLYDRLIKELSQRPAAEVEKYRAELQDLYPEEILKIYTNHLRFLATRHPCGSTYKEMRTYLMKTAEIPGGGNAAHQIIDEWIFRFPTRRMMVEMLRDVENQI